MSDFVYVDNSNVFIEGQRVSAVANGMSMNIYDAMNNRNLDLSYRVDFGKLHSFVAGNAPGSIARAALFGSRPPENDSLWQIARDAGFEVVVEDRNVANREKKIDTGIVAAMTRDAYKLADASSDTITLVAGDSDYVPAIAQLVEDGYRVIVVFWGHASRELQGACSQFVDLNPHLAHLKAL